MKLSNLARGFSLNDNTRYLLSINIEQSDIECAFKRVYKHYAIQNNEINKKKLISLV
jgi:hypothetical protein